MQSSLFYGLDCHLFVYSGFALMECTYLTAHSLFDCASGYWLFEAFKYSQNSDVFWLWLLNPIAMHASNLYVRCRSIKANTSSRQNVSPHKGLDNLHTDIISSQRSFYFGFLCGMEFQCTSGSSALLLFPCTVADSETHTARLNSHKLLCRSSLLSPSLSFHVFLSVHRAGGGRRWLLLWQRL